MTWHYLWKELLDPFFPALNSFLVTVFLKNLDPKILLKDPLFFFLRRCIYIYINIFMGPQKTFCLVIPISKSNSTKHHPKKGVLFCFLDWIALTKQWISMNSWSWRSFQKLVKTWAHQNASALELGFCFLVGWVGTPREKHPPKMN